MIKAVLRQIMPLLFSIGTLLVFITPAMARGISMLSARNASARINVRSQPTVRSSSPHYGLPGDKVQVIECVKDSDTPGSDLNWCKVKFVNSKATGWIRSDFIIFADGGE